MLSADSSEGTSSNVISIASPCFPSIQALAITSAINFTERIASSFPGIT
jgi:hypothetical protein